MSKYVRTKYGIFKVLDSEYMCGTKMYYTDKGYIPEKLALKEANTINELVDEYVYCFKDNKPIIVNEEQIKQLILLSLIQNVYGAIWTDKGLVYVAKMNDIAEVELI